MEKLADIQQQMDDTEILSEKIKGTIQQIDSTLSRLPTIYEESTIGVSLTNSQRYGNLKCSLVFFLFRLKERQCFLHATLQLIDEIFALPEGEERDKMMGSLKALEYQLMRLPAQWENLWATSMGRPTEESDSAAVGQSNEPSAV